MEAPETLVSQTLGSKEGRRENGYQSHQPSSRQATAIASTSQPEKPTTMPSERPTRTTIQGQQRGQGLNIGAGSWTLAGAILWRAKDGPMTSASPVPAPGAQPPGAQPPGPPVSPRLIDGNEQAPATVLLAHGAGAPMDSPFMAAIATGLAQHGWRVVRFEFPYMARARESGRRLPPDRLPVLQESFREQVRLERQAWPDQPLIVAGKSLGGRVASLLVDDLAASDGVGGCLCLGYPFHPPGRPQQLRTAHLAELRSPTLILQGERDPFGKPEEVEHYTLSPRVQVRWIAAGDHSFKPNRSSGLDEDGNRAVAVELAAGFLREILEAAQSGHGPAL